MKLSKMAVFTLVFGGLFFAFVATCMLVVVTEEVSIEKRIQNDFGVGQEHSVKLANVLKEVGIEDYSSVIQQVGVLEQYDRFFNVNTDKANGVLVYIKDDLTKVRVTYEGIILYKDDMVKGNIIDNVITDNEKVHFKTYAEKHIKTVLLAPDTASFPLYDGWKFGKIDGEVIVQGYVDAQNAFGAVIRSNFQIKYKAGTCTSLIIDGKEYVSL